MQVIQISVGSQYHSQYSKSLKIAGLAGCNRGQIRVSLRPYGGQEVLSRSIPCQIDSLRHFRHISGSPEVRGQSRLSRNCLSCSDTWFYYMDPFNWTADTIWTSTRYVVTFVMILIIVLLLILFVKCCCCVKNCGT